MKQYYVKTFNGKIVGSPQLLEPTDPQISNYQMIPCSNFHTFDPLMNRIKSRSIVDNSAVYVFEPYTTTAKQFQDEKDKKKQEIDQAFNDECSNGVAVSLGFTVDSKRSDLLNFENLLLFMQSNSQQSTSIADSDGVIHEVTEDQLKQLILDMISFGLSQYQKKWEIFNNIDTADCINCIREIKW